jgi:predicted transcriptional regulator
MLSAVLHTQVAAKVSVEIHRAFAAMEAKAMRDASLMLSKLQCDVLVKKPIYMRILAAAKSNMTFDQLWRSTNYARHKLETAMAEMVALGILAAPLSSQQSDLFSEG